MFDQVLSIQKEVAVRALAGLIASVAIVLVARKTRSLSPSGAVAAVIIGTAATAAGWNWATLLLGFFLSASILSRFREERKRDTLEDVAEKGRERDASQVLANGGVFAVTAIATFFYPSAILLPIAAAAISASTADTWATEIGTLSPLPPRSIISGQVVPVGTSGAITAFGTVAALAGALWIALLAIATGAGWKTAIAALSGGFIGAIIDSLLGATIQRRRWCDRCARATERTVHRCGTMTHPAGGVSWINNDAVNAISSLTGAVAGGIFLR